MPIKVCDTTITAENTFSQSVILTGTFDISISGDWSGTVTVQRSRDNATWRDVEVFTQNIEQGGFEGVSEVYYRAGIKTGDFGSGSVVVELWL